MGFWARCRPDWRFCIVKMAKVTVNRWKSNTIVLDMKQALHIQRPITPHRKCYLKLCLWFIYCIELISLHHWVEIIFLSLFYQFTQFWWDLDAFTARQYRCRCIWYGRRFSKWWYCACANSYRSHRFDLSALSTHIGKLFKMIYDEIFVFCRKI